MIDALGMANLGSVDLMKIRTRDDADRAIARFQRRTAGPRYAHTSSGKKLHYAKDRHRTLCGFKIAFAFDEGHQLTPGEMMMDRCAMCENIHEKEDA